MPYVDVQVTFVWGFMQQSKECFADGTQLTCAWVGLVCNCLW